ncbi:hypothetical protein R3P38DRAFT_2952133 [Favolaschia claudopus]|uniref:Uncharacterized protein n=1 Tax=Favolaschia claudopus TaxID=2862362 RepID=A0AAW0BG04_9AGAR
MSNLLEKGKQMLNGNSSSGTGMGGGNGMSGGHGGMTGGGMGGSGGMGAGGQKPDFVDKAFSKLETSHGIAPNSGRDERITDTVREKFESMTGKNVPNKISN